MSVAPPRACTAFPVLSGEQLQFPQSNISGCHQQPRIAYVVQLAADALAPTNLNEARLVLTFLREDRGPLLAKQWRSKRTAVEKGSPGPVTAFPVGLHGTVLLDEETENL